MFHKLKYDVTFPDTGRRLTRDLDFESGFWLITGPNESGKSFIFEMLRFALFGTAALRGEADDYKTLRMSAEFTIRGVRYSVSRTMRGAELKRGSDPVASGTTAVNKKIAEIFGYGLAIFDMAHSINQGEVERLGSLTPGARKGLIDGLLGIDSLEIISKWAMEEAKQLSRDADAIKSMMELPIPPIQPDNYVPSAQIDLELLRVRSRMLAEITGWLKVIKPKPVMPQCTVDLPAVNLEQFAVKRRTLRYEVESLRAKVAALSSIAVYTESQLAAAERDWERHDRFVAAQNWLRYHPKPEHSVEELKAWLDQWVIHERQEKIDDLTHRLFHLDKAQCPKCDHNFPIDAERAEKLREELDNLIWEQPSLYIQPSVSKAECCHLLDVWDGFDHEQYNEAMSVEAQTQPIIAREKIELFRSQITQAQEHATASAQLKLKTKELEAMPDYEQMLVERKAYEEALPRYHEQVVAYKEWVRDYTMNQGAARDMADADDLLRAGEQNFYAARTYEDALDRYDGALAKYRDQLERAEALLAKAEEHRKVKEVMILLRSLIKQHLMPSLNKVSSHLLNKMTGGQRNLIVVDEDFNVRVDGQKLDTLSGSGKACANLAIRIALGQVLTNQVFSVLMADEIDGSMDDFRAEQTSNVLYTLENTISQVLQVSHKSIESVNSIDLGGLSESTLPGEAA